MRGSPQMPSQVDPDSELPPGDGSGVEDAQPKGVQFSALSDSADAPSLTHTSSDTYIPHEVSSSSEDLSPHHAQPYPSSPPHQMRAWGTMGHDSLSVTPTPRPQPTTIPRSSDDDSPCKSTQTQPVKLQLPKAMACVLSQPDLSVSDTASNFSTARRGRESDGGRKGDEKGVYRSHSGARERGGEWGRWGESNEGVGIGERKGRSHTVTIKKGVSSDGSHCSPSAASVSEGGSNREEQNHPHSATATRESRGEGNHPHSATAMGESSGEGNRRESDGMERSRETGWAKPPTAPHTAAKPPKPKSKQNLLSWQCDGLFASTELVPCNTC